MTARKVRVCLSGAFIIYSVLLYQDRLMARSGYLERQLKEFSEATFSLGLNITAETFSLVTNFCYGSHISITPFNVASLLIAAKLLDMSETRGLRDENLCQKTENYFRLVVTVNLEYISIVLQSCFSLLPEVETTACLVSRCIEALSSMGDVEAVTSCLHDVKKLCLEDFQLILKSTSQRLIECHDLLYVIIDLYLKVWCSYSCLSSVSMNWSKFHFQIYWNNPNLIFCISMFDLLDWRVSNKNKEHQVVEVLLVHCCVVGQNEALFT